MILVLGVGIVGKAVIEYFKNEKICFFDDQVKVFNNVEPFSNWNDIKLVVVSPGIGLKHDMVQEAVKRNIKITNDIGIFLENNKKGIKIGITGTNGKSTNCALLKHALGEKASIGGNFGVSPLSLPESEYYILELSSYQLELLDPKKLALLDLGIIINIYPHHLERHGSFDDYVSIKCKILSAKKKILGFCDVFDTWNFEKAVMPEKFPENVLFENIEYKYAWGVVQKALSILNFDQKKGLENAKSYKVLPFRQEVILNNPITIINDSKSTNSIATKFSITNMKKRCCLLAGGIGNDDWDFLKDFKEKFIKIFIYGNCKNLKEAVKKNNIEFQDCGDSFEEAAQNSIAFCLENRVDLLFSPGHQSFDMFKNFENRGNVFNEIVKKATSQR